MGRVREDERGERLNQKNKNQKNKKNNDKTVVRNGDDMTGAQGKRETFFDFG